jgi:alkaline phosphatase D
MSFLHVSLIRVAILTTLALSAGCSRAATIPDFVASEEVITRVAYASCLKQHKPQPAWDAVNRFGPQIFVLMGDNVYVDATTAPAFEAAYRALEAVSGFQRLRANARLLATWDDHDFGRNDAGSEFPAKATAQQAFLSFLKPPIDSPLHAQTGVYSSYIQGPPGRRVQFILLDLRTFRDPWRSLVHRGYAPDPGTDPTMLGEAQWKWLRERLADPADVRVIVSSIQFLTTEQPYERWGRFPRERERLLALLTESRERGLVILSGDRHFAEISVLETGSKKLVEVTASGFNAGVKRAVKWPNSYREGEAFFADNFGTLSIDWADGTVLAEVRDEDGEVRLSQPIKLRRERHGTHQGEQGLSGSR